MRDKRKLKKKFLVFALVMMLVASAFMVFFMMTDDTTAEAQFVWWNTDYNYRREIIIESDYINGSTLTNFPIIIHIPDEIGDKCDGGNSLSFLSSIDSGELYFEIEKWEDGSDRIVFVNVTSIAHDSDTSIYMYYNDSTATPSAYNSPNDVWDANYIGVYHCNQSGGADYKLWDSTIYGRLGDNTGASFTYQADSIAGYGVKNDALDEYMLLNKSYGIRTTDFTLELWINMDNWYPNPANAYSIPFSLYADGSFMGVGHRDSTGITSFRWLVSGTPYEIEYTNTIQTGDWHYYASSYDNDGDAEAWYDGVSNGTNPNTGNIDTATAGNSIGGFNTGEIPPATTRQEAFGTYDEIRISNITRSGAWIEATYHNINESTHLGDFLAFETEESKWQLWNNYIEITISHEFIDEVLTEFPMLVYINDTIADRCDGGNSINFLNEL
jgi:hypothetical protein